MVANFLWQAGASNSGLLVPAVSLLTTELNSLAINGTVVSSVGGSSGVFTNSNMGQGIWGHIFATFGAVGSNTTTPASVCGWFLKSFDGGTTFEASTTPRAPDFAIPVPSNQTILANTVYEAEGIVRIPAIPFKVLFLNLLGQAMASSGNILRVAPAAVQY